MNEACGSGTAVAYADVVFRQFLWVDTSTAECALFVRFETD